jgi:type I restriction enzyme S subunit
MIRVVELRNYVEILSGFAFDSNLFNDSHDGIPLIRIRDVGKNFSKTFFSGQYDEKYIVKNGDYLIGMDGDFRLSEWKGVDALLNQRVCKISVTKLNELSEKYLLHFLPKELKLIEDSTSFATVKHLSVEKVKKIQIPLPPLPQQQKIANILDAADALRQNDKALIAKYDELTQALFLDMFGDPMSNPKGWEKVKMDNLMTILRGGSPRPIDNYLGGTYPWIKIGDATKGDDIYLNSTKECITKDGLKKTRLLPKGSLIFANCGVSLGFARILTFEGCIHDGWLAFSNFNEEKLNKIFLLKALNSITQYFRDTAPDGTQPNLNIAIMKNFELIMPPISMQKKFETTLSLLVEQKAIAQKSLEKSESLFNSLLQKAFKGEL